MRSYDEYCAIAKSLDVVGDRWTLLIVRELSLRGGCRYTDLRNGLPGIASNLLADRLRELEHAGVVAREEAPPPIATTLFSLTPRGAELEPVLAGLMRWGVPLMAEQKPQDAVQSHWLAGALETLLVDGRPGDSPATIELRTGDRPIVVEARDGAIAVRLGSSGDASAVVSGAAKPILRLLFGSLSAAEAQDAGIEIDGDRTVLERFVMSGGTADGLDRLQSSVPRS
jgi:DNA-binding HxlR family transcriptional regulator